MGLARHLAEHHARKPTWCPTGLAVIEWPAYRRSVHRSDAAPPDAALNQGRRSLVQLPQNGGCLCGALRYEITRMPIAVYTCHCTNCQRLLGSAFSMSFIVADEAFHLSGGDPRPIQRITIADVRRPGGSAPNAPRSTAADQSLDCHQQLRFAVCGPARWTTPLGCDRRLISGHAARSPGSCCLQMDRGSRHSQRTLWGSCYRSRRRAAAFEPSDARSRFAELRALRKDPRYDLAQQRAAVRPCWRRRCRVTLGPAL
jgi:hypothetical protein